MKRFALIGFAILLTATIVGAGTSGLTNNVSKSHQPGLPGQANSLQAKVVEFNDDVVTKLDAMTTTDGIEPENLNSGLVPANVVFRDIFYTGTAGTDSMAGVPLASVISRYSVWEDDFYEGGYIADAIVHTNMAAYKFSETADGGAWLVTVVDGGSDDVESITISDTGPFGVLAIQNNNAKDDGESIQKNGLGVELVSGKKLWFETKFSVEDADTNAVFIGLSIADTTMTAGLSNDHIGFSMTGLVDAKLYLSVEAGNTNSTYTTTTTMANSHAAFTNMTTAGFYYDGASTLYTWIGPNGTTIAMSTTVVQTAAIKLPIAKDMSPIIEIIGKDTNTDNLYVDYIKVVQER